MQLKRLFSTEEVKGTRNYLSTQKKYELVRTLLYFAISLALFVGGWIQTGNRMNLLTIVAILGCLPASKSAVETFMYFRFPGCSNEIANKISSKAIGLAELYDCVFTSYQVNYEVSHLVVKGNTICGYTEKEAFDENAFNKHIQDILKLDGHKDITVKIFKNLEKYLERVEQLKQLEAGSEEKTSSVINTLKSVML